MEPSYLTSSPAEAKRLFAEEAQNSPSSKRAKRRRTHREARLKSRKAEADAVFEPDGMSDAAPTPASVASKRAPKVENSKDAGCKMETADNAKEKGGELVTPADLGEPSGVKREAGAKARSNPMATTPAVAGPSQPPARNGNVVLKAEEWYVPLSELPVSPPRDYTFKAFPDPEPLRFGGPVLLPSSLRKDEKKIKRGSIRHDAVLGKHEALSSPVTAASPKTEEMKAEQSSEQKKKKKKNKKKDNTVAEFEVKAEEKDGQKPSQEDVVMEDVVMKDADADADGKADEKAPVTPPCLLADDKILAAPAGTRTLKAISKHLKHMAAKLDASRQPTADPEGKANAATSSEGNPPTMADASASASALATTTTTTTAMAMATLHEAVAHLHTRVELADLRASVRHDVLFSALFKVATDVSELSQAVHKNQHQHQHQHQQLLTSRKTYEQCLRIYTADMDRASTREEAAKFGQLVLKYVGDLLKTLG
ncbi:hypothetical protein VTJ83DRAFT_3094 [Remersonia thermophila]|uniref:Uncharacterized protein n=1 Tax=Remersonia thermophila TaxID=72144 RepID=A0ABR4DD26_9PEZI